MGKLDGKVAIVTGASSGIGEATALALAEEGAKVVGTARRSDRLEELGKRIGEGFLAVTADVRREDDCERIVEESVDRFGRVDILVNNAGVMLLGPVPGADTEDWRRMIDTNLYGLIYCTHKALPTMLAQGSGHIVNISSVAGRTAGPMSGVYNLTKWGVNGFSESLRQQVYDKNIRVTVIEPGAVATELRDHITVPQVKAETDAWAESMEQLESEDIAAAVLYAVTQPRRVNVNEILIRPTDQRG
jgi:NADP-dependent 3-hydroxy acid dehydrogenase YdfG